AVFGYLESNGFRVAPHVSRMASWRPRRTRRAVVAGRLETRLLAFVQRRTGTGFGSELRRRLGAAPEGVAHRVRKHGDRRQRNAAIWRALHPHPAACQLEVRGIRLEVI